MQPPSLFAEQVERFCADLGALVGDLPVTLGVAVSATQAPAARQLRIIVFGAHPDDAELQAAGVAAMWAAQGHKVKFVAATNGDIGHFSQAGGPLAIRRTAAPGPLRAASPSPSRSRLGVSVILVSRTGVDVCAG